MKSKKDRPEAATSERHCPGLQPRNKIYDHYIKFPAECKPQFGRERGYPPMSWAMVLTWIGAAGLVRQLSRLIDWMERG